MSDPTWLLEREVVRFERQRTATLRWWQDAASGRIDGRFLGEHHRLAGETVSALRDHGDAARAADAAAHEVDTAVEATREALQRASTSLEGAGEELRTAGEFAEAAENAATRADTHLRAALEAVGRAGAACGEAPSSPAQLRTRFDRERSQREGTIDHALHVGSELADIPGHPWESIASELAGPMAGTTVGAGLTGIQLADALRPLWRDDNVGDVNRRLARRRVRQAMTRLTRSLPGR